MHELMNPKVVKVSFLLGNKNIDIKYIMKDWRKAACS